MTFQPKTLCVPHCIKTPLVEASTSPNISKYQMLAQKQMAIPRSLYPRWSPSTMLSSTSRSPDLVNACRIRASSGDRGGCYHSIPVHEKVCQLAQLENVVLQVSFTSLPIPLNSITAVAHVASSQLSLLLGPKTTFLLQLAQCEKKKYYR